MKIKSVANRLEMSFRLKLKLKDKSKEVTDFFSVFSDMCEWLKIACPENLLRYADVQKWAYGELRKRYNAPAFLYFRASGKVSSERTAKNKIDSNIVLFDKKSFTFKPGAVGLLLLRKKIWFEYEIITPDPNAQNMACYEPQSGLLVRNEEGVFFELKMVVPQKSEIIYQVTDHEKVKKQQ